jgi:hypothetical protein
MSRSPLHRETTFTRTSLQLREGRLGSVTGIGGPRVTVRQSNSRTMIAPAARYGPKAIVILRAATPFVASK